MLAVPILLSTLLAVVVEAATIQVAVGSKGLVFDPISAVAQPGDVIQFSVASGHIVAQSQDFNHPCSNLQDGIHSSSAAVQFNVTNSNPIWWHCDMPGHCQAGMVFAINPPTSRGQTIQKYQAVAVGKSVNVTTSAGASATSIQPSSATGPTSVSGSNAASEPASGPGSDSASAAASATSSAAPSAATSASTLRNHELPDLVGVVGILVGMIFLL